MRLRLETGHCGTVQRGKTNRLELEELFGKLLRNQKNVLEGWEAGADSGAGNTARGCAAWWRKGILWYVSVGRHGTLRGGCAQAH